MPGDGAVAAAGDDDEARALPDISASALACIRLVADADRRSRRPTS